MTEFIITGILLTQGKLNGARVHVRRALLAGATPRELFQAIAAAAIPGGVPVVWHGAAMVKAEMNELGLTIDQRYSGAEERWDLFCSGLVSWIERHSGDRDPSSS